MQASTPLASERRYRAGSPGIPDPRKTLGRTLLVLASLVLAAVLLIQVLYATGAIETGFETWRPALYAFLLWSVALGASQALTRGEQGYRALLLLPGLLFTIAMVIFPTFFGLYIAFTSWNLRPLARRQFTAPDNLAA